MLAKTLAAAGMLASIAFATDAPVSRVCVKNKAAFVLQFYFENTASGEKSELSEHYPVY